MYVIIETRKNGKTRADIKKIEKGTALKTASNEVMYYCGNRKTTEEIAREWNNTATVEGRYLTWKEWQGKE